LGSGSLRAEPSENLAFEFAGGDHVAIRAVQRNGSHEHPLTSPIYTGPDVTIDKNPAISPDGRSVVFERRMGECKPPDIYVVPVSGGRPRQLTHHLQLDCVGSPYAQPTWSPDGSKIAFFSHRRAGYGLYVMDSTGRHQRRLGPIYGQFRWLLSAGPSWAPDSNE
jgi:Tol biopolymer transport system component